MKIDETTEPGGSPEARRIAAKMRSRLDAYSASIAPFQHELNSLLDAAERHRKRRQDEMAFERAELLMRCMRGCHAEADEAARLLGEDPPAPIRDWREL